MSIPICSHSPFYRSFVVMLAKTNITPIFFVSHCRTYRYLKIKYIGKNQVLKKTSKSMRTCKFKFGLSSI